MMENALVHFLAIVFGLLLIVSQNGCYGGAGTISCFVCSSRNGSYPECEDPFNAGVGTYVERCKVPRRGHTGEFPAHFCVKLKGTSYTTNEKIVIRRCTSETMDTQCGKFRFEEDLLRGCILTCDLDGCNSSALLEHSQSITLICTIVGLLCFWLATSTQSHQNGFVADKMKIRNNKESQSDESQADTESQLMSYK